MSVAANNTIVDRNSITDNPDVAELVSAYKALAAPIEARVVGKLTETFERAKTLSGESEAGNLIADSQLAATDDEQGAVAAFMNPGGVRADFPFNAPDGALTYKNIFEVQPFGNNLTTLTV